jgi:hypothetical protein
MADGAFPRFGNRGAIGEEAGACLEGFPDGSLDAFEVVNALVILLFFAAAGFCAGFFLVAPEVVAFAGFVTAVDPEANNFGCFIFFRSLAGAGLRVLGLAVGVTIP